MYSQGFTRHSSFVQKSSWIVFILVVPLYLGWQVAAFLEWRVPGIALPLFTAELFYAFHTLVFLFTTREFWVPIQQAQAQTSVKPTVDIFIPTINEPEDVVAMTVRAALGVRGISNVYVLDDGNRTSIRELSASLGVQYFARGNNLHAKAGNMNFGLSHSHADFVAFFDADHIPCPNFIERMLPFFQDEKLAFVQPPQVFYNLDSFQHKPLPGREGWNEQAMFYGSIQPAKNKYNAAFFCGTNALFRRKALDDIGGIATGTATEDVHTSLRLHARGWKSLYLPEVLAVGLAPADLKEYYRQRVRWGAGSLGLLLRTKDSPLVVRGLTRMQRLCYIMSTSFFLAGIFKLVYVLVPISVIVFQTTLSAEPLINYFGISMVYLFFSLLTITLQSRGTYHWWHTEQFNVINTFANLTSLKGVVRVQKKFSPTVKKKFRFERAGATYALCGLVLLLLIADVAGVLKVLSGAHITALAQNPVLISIFWNTVNLLFAGGAVIHVARNERYQKHVLKKSHDPLTDQTPTYGQLPWAFTHVEDAPIMIHE